MLSNTFHCRKRYSTSCWNFFSISLHR